MSTNIEWTDETWNPVRGCSRVSPGCMNCYAERQAIRQSGPLGAYEGLVHIANGHPAWTGKVDFATNHLEDPLHWRAPRRVFVNSMSDLFHENVAEEWIDEIFAVMAACPQHTFQILTKRPERMLDYFLKYAHLDVRGAFIGQHIGKRHLALTGEPVAEWPGLPLPNVWLGVSVENQKYADERIPLLLETPAAVRFISAEPLLDEIVLSHVLNPSREGYYAVAGTAPLYINALRGYSDNGDWRKLDWVIVGGESGPVSRPFRTEWAASLVEQCRDAGVACFVKQLGAHIIQDGERHRKRDKKGGDWHEWPHELRVREFPGVAHG